MYALMGLAAWMVWTHGGWHAQKVHYVVCLHTSIHAHPLLPHVTSMFLCHFGMNMQCMPPGLQSMQLRMAPAAWQ